MSKCEWVTIDTETTGLNPWTGDRMFSVAWTTDKERQGYIDWDVNPFTREVIYKVPSSSTSEFEDIISDERIVKVCHNLKFDKRMTSVAGYEMKGRLEDTLIALFCVKNDLPTYGLKWVGKIILGIPTSDEEELKNDVKKKRIIGKKLGWKLAEDVEADYWMADRKLVRKYNVLDTYRTYLLWHFVKDKMSQLNVRDVYEKEMELLKVTYSMETRGVRIDREMVEKEILTHNKIALEKKKEIDNVAGGEINLKSPIQVSNLFYNKLKMPVYEKTAGGNPAVGKYALCKLHDTYPIVRTYEQYKASTHAVDNFFGKYLNLMVKEKDYYTLHPSFNQTGAITGRYSCRMPNLQNVANNYTHRMTATYSARAPFGPRKGYTWYLFDYSQIELRIFAVESKEKFLLDALLAGRDVMTEIANHVWGDNGKIDIVKIEKDKLGRSDTRTRAKCLMYGRLYGIGLSGAVDLLLCSKEQAKIYLEEFSQTFPGIDTFMDKMSTEGLVKGYITNKYGRRFNIDREFSYRATNYLIQGSAADFLKDRMIAVHKYLTDRKLDAHLLMTIHDELVFEISNKIATKSLLSKIKSIMEDHGGKFLPLPKLQVEVKRVTKCWDNKEDLDV